MNISAIEGLIIGAVSEGLPATIRPYMDIGARYGIDEETVIETIGSLIKRGIISRFGLIVRHRQLGFTENAMVVWDVPDELVKEIAGRFTKNERVTLCYQRPRRLPDWPYNLFCMIHGKERQTVLSEVAALAEATQIEGVSHEVLFSTRVFKQRGAKYAQKAVE